MFFSYSQWQNKRIHFNLRCSNYASQSILRIHSVERSAAANDKNNRNAHLCNTSFYSQYNFPMQWILFRFYRRRNNETNAVFVGVISAVWFASQESARSCQLCRIYIILYQTHSENQHAVSSLVFGTRVNIGTCFGIPLVSSVIHQGNIIFFRSLATNHQYPMRRPEPPDALVASVVALVLFCFILFSLMNAYELMFVIATSTVNSSWS